VEFVGRLLSAVEPELKQQNVSYEIQYTHPTRDFFKVNDDCLYIIRQRTNGGRLELVVAAKMRKEVSNNGL
jgi:hypothetical protein